MGSFILGLIIFLILSFIKSWSHKKRFKKAVKIFYDQSFPIPRIETSTSYGLPCYTIHLSTYFDYMTAEKLGLIRSFKEEIQKLHDSSNYFDAEKAVFFRFRDE